MSKRSLSTCAFALALSPALWALPGAGPALAHPSGDPDCYAPPFSLLVSPCVPHDVPAGPSATVAELAFFAWQEFIALNWMALDPPSSGQRGRPVAPTDPMSGFFGVKPDAEGNYPLVVWQTYRHKNEMFPADGNTEPSFDSPFPIYSYANQPTPATGGPIPSFSLFNNLDETSQIGLDNMYAYATTTVQPAAPAPATGTRVAYEAKVNRAVFNYVVQNGFTNAGTSSNPYPTLNAALSNTQANLPKVAGTCSTTVTGPIVMLPCGDINVDGDAGEGAIEIKAAWRKLTDDELRGRALLHAQGDLLYRPPEQPSLPQRRMGAGGTPHHPQDQVVSRLRLRELGTGRQLRRQRHRIRESESAEPGVPEHRHQPAEHSGQAGQSDPLHGRADQCRRARPPSRPPTRTPSGSTTS